MPRIRTVKPEFFRHEALQDLEASHPGQYLMLVFLALWGHCDKEGRFLWKHRSLKLDILPFLEFDLSASLVLLREAELIRQYEIDGETYGEIPTFKKHQRISGREAQEDAKYPEPKEFFSNASNGSKAEATRKHLGRQEGNGREWNREGKGKEDGRASATDEIVFEGSFFRKVTEQNLSEWLRAYPTLDRNDALAELRAGDDYYAEIEHPPKNWFFSASGWLKRVHDKRAEAKRKEQEAEDEIYAGVH